MSTQTSPENDQSEQGFTIVKRKRWPFIVGAVVVIGAIVAAFVYSRVGGSDSAVTESGATLKVAYLESNPAEKAVIDFIRDNVAADYDIKVEGTGIADSTQINRAISEGELAGTIFQHEHWLGQVLDSNPDFKEQAGTGPFFHWIFGIWSDKYSSPQDIPENARVSLLADPANQAQGLWYLEQAGLIKLRAGADVATLTPKDIVENPKNLQFTLLDFGAQPRALSELDAVVGYAESFVAAGISEDKLIFSPPSPNQFASVLTVGSNYVESDNIQNLIKAFKDPRVQKFIATDPETKKLILPADPTAANNG
ncbi:metal ABC transporter substrate-binding protein [Gordonia desulfuricans]|uniref:Metal ABC transporter substrate-binding protein n=1 Tax=Gordonia desulfuricans TaxID=89051 RepID=A0A7K3LR09_9ACTN|nr:MetQ/NlpA family ABC transporter substrate-binding protein [Gordonia desulfuricans]NDK89987.1 metal ABC transporter substrate-binding protein [Gordonia desulfuricans]